MAFGEREVEGILIIGCARFDIGSVLDQDPGNFQIAVQRGGMEGGESTFLAGIHVSAMFHQGADYFEIPASGGGVQRHVGGSIFGARVDAGSAS